MKRRLQCCVVQWEKSIVLNPPRIVLICGMAFETNGENSRVSQLQVLFFIGLLNGNNCAKSGLTLRMKWQCVALETFLLLKIGSDLWHDTMCLICSCLGNFHFIHHSIIVKSNMQKQSAKNTCQLYVLQTEEVLTLKMVFWNFVIRMNVNKISK